MQNVKVHLFASSIFSSYSAFYETQLKDRQRVFKGLSFSLLILPFFCVHSLRPLSHQWVADFQCWCRRWYVFSSENSRASNAYNPIFLKYTVPALGNSRK